MSNNKISKEDLYELSPVEIYDLVLEGKVLKKFPNGFWQSPEATDNAITITKYLIEEKLKLTEEELKEQLCINLFRKYKLGGMLIQFFNNSPFDVIELCYPNTFYPWEFKNVSQNYWDEENIKKATKWLIEKKLKLSNEELKKQLSAKLFIDNGLRGMLHLVNNSPYEVINLVYKDKFQPWEFNQVPQRYWQDEENIKKATKWLIEKKLKLSDEELKKQLSYNLFMNNGLRGILKTIKESPYEAIELTYPGKFKPWEFNVVPNNYWNNKENRLSAIKWLIEEQLKLNNEELNKINTRTFKENGLSGLLFNGFKGSPKKAIEEYLNYYNS